MNFIRKEINSIYPRVSVAFVDFHLEFS